ncbi:MAG: DNA-directed RNA polymerase subunit D [Halobacteriota archaeon]
MSEAAGYEVEFVVREERRAVFVVRGISPAFANGIRRAILADMPTMAIDTVRVVENTSVMFDEMIALRLGLVPLNTPPDEFEVGDEVTLSVDVSGEATVYSGDLVSADSQVVPVDENIPIIDLKEGQRLEVEADAVYQPGSEHVKHQGGVAVGYTHLRRVEVTGDLGEFEEPEPVIVRGVIEEDGELIPAEAFDNDLRNRYPDQAIDVIEVPGAFVFHVESDGSMPVEDLVVAAASTLGDRARELEEALQL